MKKTSGFLLGAAVGMASLALYQKYSPDMMRELKKTVNKMSKEANKCINDMM